MIKRTIEISREPCYLTTKLDQLVVQPFDAPKEDATSIPAEDIGVVVVDHAQATYSHGALQTLLHHGACVVICGRDHQPAGLLLPISSHTQQVERLQTQIAASKPTIKRLWQQVVTAKVESQSGNLCSFAQDDPERLVTFRRKLDNLARRVKSGDTTNIEAQAAKVYWAACRACSGEVLREWRRDPNGTDSLNAHLNYGYAILRAAVARALVAAGLQPALGLHHRNRANAFCLADDLMEPLRPVIDREAIALVLEERCELDQPNKARLLSTLTADVVMGDQHGPLMVQLHRMTASLIRCLEGEEKELAIPWPSVFNSSPDPQRYCPQSPQKNTEKHTDLPSRGRP